MRVVIHERDEREKEKKRKRKRETLRKKNSSSFPLNSVSVDDDALIKRNVVSKKDEKKEKRRKKEGIFSFFFFRRLPLAPLCFGRFTPIIFIIIINIIIRFLLKPMNNECTNTLFKVLALMRARAARRRRKRQQKFRNLIVSLSPPHLDETTRR